MTSKLKKLVAGAPACVYIVQVCDEFIVRAKVNCEPRVHNDLVVTIQDSAAIHNNNISSAHYTT